MFQIRGRCWYSAALAVMVACLPETTALALGQAENEATDILENGEVIEEIIVFGEKSMPQLKQEIFRTQENFFAVFSALNDDDEYDVRCFMETGTGTRIRRHVCRARFVTDAYSRAAARFVGGVPGPFQDPELVVTMKSKRFEEKMTNLIAAHPELKDALDDYTKARLTYETERQRRFVDK